MFWKRGLGVFFLAWSIALCIASITSIEWVDNTDTLASNNGSKYFLGLRKWKRVSGNSMYSSSEQDYDSSQWPGGTSSFLGPSNGWKEAGLAALALGAIGVSFTIISFLAGIADLLTRNVSKTVTSLTAFLGGAIIILGAIIYEGMRPGLRGDMGYNWPVGIYLVSSICSTIAAFMFWWSDDKY